MSCSQRYPELSARVTRRSEDDDRHPRSRSPRKLSATPQDAATGTTRLWCAVCGEAVLTLQGDEVTWIQDPPSTTTTNSSMETSPLYGLQVPTSGSSSTFGLPPSAVPSPMPITFLAPMHDPFFLPPPFTPSHPYFHDLTIRATAKVEALRQQTEREIREYIEYKRREIDHVESSVRSEVERAWKAFELANRLQGIDVDSSHAPSSSRQAQSSTSVPARRVSFGSTTGRPQMASSPSPAAQVSTGFPPSLLSASLSANAFVRPDWQRSRSPQDLGSNPITAPYHASKVDLDVAASLRVSNMPEFDRQENNGIERRMRRRSGSSDIDPIVARSPSESQSSKNGSEGRGVEDIELNPFAASTQPSASSSYQDDERTPRTRTIKDLGRSLPEAEEDGLESQATTAKEETTSSRKRVTFQEPAPVDTADQDSDEAADEQQRSEQPSTDTTTAVDTPSTAAAESVFDFEDHDKPPPPPVQEEDESAAGNSASSSSSEVAKSAQSVESKLIALVAGDAPSHRAAWRNNKRGLWHALGRTSKPSRRQMEDDGTEEITYEEEEDEQNLSPYASSVPIEIALPARRSNNSLMLEPKTSLTERAGVLVPPLKLAMQRTRSGSGSRRKPSLTIIPPTTIPENATVNGGGPSIPNNKAAMISPKLNRSRSGSINASVPSVPIPGSYESPTTATTTRGPGGVTSSTQPAYSLRDRSVMQADRDPGPALEAVGE